MNFLKLKDKAGKDVLVNLDSVSFLYAPSETSTNIAFYSDEFIVTPVPIDILEKAISEMGGKITEIALPGSAAYRKQHQRLNSFHIH